MKTKVQKTRAPKRVEWPDWFPPKSTLSGRQQEQLSELSLRLPQRMPAPNNVPREVLRDRTQWSRVAIDLSGRLSREGEVAYVTRWNWEALRQALPDITLRIGGNGHGGRYVYPSSAKLNQRVQGEGGQRNSITLAPMLITVAGLADWHSRSKFLDGDPLNCTIFNLGLSPFPLTPKGEDAKRMRLSLRVTAVALDESHAGVARIGRADSAKWGTDAAALHGHSEGRASAPRKDAP